MLRLADFWPRWATGVGRPNLGALTAAVVVATALTLAGGWLTATTTAAEGTTQDISERYPDGKPWLKYTVNEAGQRHGPYIEYHAETGKPKLKATYREDRLHGPLLQYDEDGRLAVRATYLNDRRNGVYEELASDGKKRVAANYRQGELSGKYQEFHANGRPRVSANYVGDRLSGLYLEYHPDGSERLRAIYKDGVPDGEIVERDSAGKVAAVETYKGGRSVGSLRLANYGLTIKNGVPYYHGRSAEMIRTTLAKLDPPGSGTVSGDSPEQRDAALQRLKAYRYLVGVPYENLQLDNEYNSLCVAASKICRMIGRLDHTPPNPGLPDAEYRYAYKGTSSSNLAMGYGSLARAIDGYMDDSDPSNISRVGHRRWCLNPAMGKTGFGMDGRFSAMYSFDTSAGRAGDYDYIAYPPPGFMPTRYFGARHAWNVTLNPQVYRLTRREGQPETIKAHVYELDANLRKSDQPLPLDFFRVSTEYIGIPLCVILRPTGLNVTAGARYLLEIHGLERRDGNTAPLSFVVEFINLAGS